MSIFKDFFISSYNEFKTKVAVPVSISLKILKNTQSIKLLPKPIIKIIFGLVQEDFILKKIEKKFCAEFFSEEQKIYICKFLASHIFFNIIYQPNNAEKNDIENLWKHNMQDFTKLLQGEITDYE